MNFNPADYPHNCHAAALALVREKGPGWRVARGYTRGVPGQHSWAVKGGPYEPEQILDPTIWSYTDREPEIIEGNPLHYIPHGKGTIWASGPPVRGNGPNIDLKIEGYATHFMDLIGPLDRVGWANLVHGPMEGWPSKAVIEAMLDHQDLKALVPIDIAGMVTDRNPGGLYW